MQLNQVGTCGYKPRYDFDLAISGDADIAQPSDIYVIAPFSFHQKCLPDNLTLMFIPPYN